MISLRENDFQRPAKGGSTPAFACQHAANIICFAKRGLLAHTSAAFLKKLLHRKTFWLPAARFPQRLLKYFL